MAKRFYTNIDLRYNRLLNGALENIDSTSVASQPFKVGRIYFGSDANSVVIQNNDGTRILLHNGSTLNPRNINQLGFDSTEQVLLVSQEQIDAWQALANDSTNIERIENKNQPDGYAGLDSTGKLDIAVLWDGMVVEDPENPGEFITLGQILDSTSYSIPRLDANNLLDPTILKQTGFDSTAQVLLVSQEQIDQWDLTATFASDATSFERLENKGQPDGYAPLNSSSQIDHEYMADGVIIRNTKVVAFDFTGTVEENDQFIYEIDDTGSEILVVNAGETLEDVVARLASDMAGEPKVNTVFNVTSTTLGITLTSSNPGVDTQVTLYYVPLGSSSTSITKEITQPAFYDLSNIGGVPDKGFAPIASDGKVPLTYLPNQTDSVVVANITERDALVSGGDVFDALRVHVIDASDDTSVDSGWADYIWYADATSWNKYGEQESLDVQHNNLEGLQSDSTSNYFHLSLDQINKVRNSEELIEYSNVDASEFLLYSFDSTEYRSADVSIVYEDLTNRTVYSSDVKILFNGNFADYLEHNTISPNPFAGNFDLFTRINDTDRSVELYLSNGGTDVDVKVRAKLYPSTIDVKTLLMADEKLLPGNFVIPETTGYLVPGATLTPSNTLEPNSP